MGYPVLPSALSDHLLDNQDLSDLWRELIVEILDADYQSRTHGNRRTYDVGCHGPMCSKAVREHGRKRTGTEPSERYKQLDPIIDHWRPIAEAMVLQAYELMVEELTA